MVKLTPIDGDPFAASVGLTPVDYDPFNETKPKRPTGPVFENRAPINLGMAARHPLYAAGQLWDRVKEAATPRANDADIPVTSLEIAAKSLGRGMGEAPIPRERLPAYNAPKSGLELTADLAGGFARAAPAPESLIALPAKAAAALTRTIAPLFGRTALSSGAQRIATQAAVRGLEGGAVNAAADIPIQGANMALGDQEKYSLESTGLNALFGAGLGSAMGAVGEVGPVRRDAQRVENRKVDEYIFDRDRQLAGKPTGEPKPKLQPVDYDPFAGGAPQVDMGNPITEPDQGVAPEIEDVAAMMSPGARPTPDEIKAVGEELRAAVAELEAERGKLSDTRGQGVQYHGARSEVGDLSEGYYNPDNIYGGNETFYTTDATEIASGYGRRNPNAVVYRVAEKQPVNFFDMETPRTQAEWEEMLYGRVFAADGGDAPTYIWHELQGIEAATGENGGRANLREVMDEIRDSSRADGYSKDDVQEMFTAITSRLQDLGYGGMRHVGGLKTKRAPHDVKIYFRPWEQIELHPHQPEAAGPSPELAARVERAQEAARALNERHRETLAMAPEPDDVDARTTGVNLRSQPKLNDQGIPDPTKLQRFDRNVKQMAADLRKALGVTHRQGRMTVANALGLYYRKTGVVRTKAMHELDVLAHESAHHLEFTRPKDIPNLVAAMQRHENELRVLDYDPQQLRRHEGFAEWFRVYVTNPADAWAAAPNFTPEFEVALKTDKPEAFEQIKRLQDEYAQWVAATPAARMSARITYQGRDGLRAKIKNKLEQEGAAGIARTAYTQAVDRLHPIAQARDELIKIIEHRTGRKVDLKAAFDPYKLARLMPAAYSAGHMDIMRGVSRYDTFDGEGPSLAGALEQALGPRNWDQEAIADFDGYLIARRFLGEYERYAQGKLDQQPDVETKEALEQAVMTYEAANPTFYDAAAKVYEWQTNLWRKKFEGGLISDTTYLAGLDHIDYVPAMRDRDDVPGAKRGLERTGTGENAGKVQAFRGSTRNPISPIQSMMKDAYRTSAILARNDVYKQLYKLAETAKAGSGAIVEKLPIPVEVTNLEKMLAEFAADHGLAPRDIVNMLDDVKAAIGLRANEKLATFKAGEFNAMGEPVIYLWENGQVVPLRLADGAFGEELFDALTNLTPMQKTLVSDMLAIPSRIQRIGIVTHPTFLITNAIRDAITTFITTDVGYIPVVDTVRGMKMNLEQGQRAEQYNRAGGIIGGVMTSTEREGRLEQSIKALRTKGFQIERFANWKTVAHLAELSETGTRLGVFDRAVQDNLAKGMSEREAIIEAAFTARDYMDFDKRGASASAQAVTSLDTFLRAWTISMDKFVEVTKGAGNLKKVMAPLAGGPPATEAERRAFNMAVKAYSTMAGLGIMSMGLTQYMLANEPEFEQINDDLRATHWIFKFPDWVPEMGGKWAFVPKPFEWGTLPNAFERAAEGLAGDPLALKRFGADMAHIFAPPFNVPVVTIPYDLARNKTSMGQPIIPDHMLNAEPELQVSASTSQFARDVGGILNLSPAVVDHVIKSVTTSWGRTVIGFYDEALGGQAPREGQLEDGGLTSRFVKNPARGNRSSEMFWEKVSTKSGEWSKNLNSYRAFLNDEVDPNKATEYLRSLEPDARAYVMMAALPELKGEERRIHPMIMAQSLIGEMGALRNALRKGDPRGAGLQFIDLTPAERTAADNALQQRIMAVANNALARSGVEGWEHAGAMPLDPLPPQVEDALSKRLAMEIVPTKAREAALANPAVVAGIVAQADANWTSLKPAIDALNAEVVSQYTNAARGEGTAGVSRFVDQVRPAR